MAGWIVVKAETHAVPSCVPISLALSTYQTAPWAQWQKAAIAHSAIRFRMTTELFPVYHRVALPKRAQSGEQENDFLRSKPKTHSEMMSNDP